MWLYIQPNDTMFLRDGRPFDAGADVWAGCVFPPYPSTCYGMLRSLLVHIVNKNIDYKAFFKNVPEALREIVGDTVKLGSLSIRGPFLAEKNGNKIYLHIPAPSDLFFDEDENGENNYYLLQPFPKSHLNDFSDTEMPFCPLRFHEEIDGSELEQGEGIIGEYHLAEYLKGDTKKSLLQDFQIENEFWKEEHSTIIKRSYETLTAEEHQLAQPTHIRMNERENQRGLLIHLDDAQNCFFEGIHTGRIGGEGRVCFIEKASVENIPDDMELIERIKETGFFRVILTSPGYFPVKGFYPDFLDDNNGNLPEGEWNIEGENKRVRLVAMSTGQRATRIGGWNLATGAPKTMIKAVPVGSVYYFELPDFDKNKDEKWITQLVASSLPGMLPGGKDEYCKQGFNTMLIGGWDYVS